jgi:(p)ppGpp synthase/HD superfamily hydrolase
MSVAQKIEDTVEFAKEHYRAQLSVHKRTLLQHAVAVAKLAEVIGAKLYQDVREDYMSEDTKESVAVIVHGAILHDVINVGRCPFEYIAERTTVQIAAMVADLSRDFRLVETKRDMEFRGRLSTSTVGTQIVAVADIICTAQEIVALLNDQGAAAIPQAKKLVIQLDGDLLAIHAASRFYPLRLYTHAARNLLQDASKLIKECRSRARTERATADTVTRIQAKVAARQRAATESSLPPTKEKRRGKKRTHREDS